MVVLLFGRLLRSLDIYGHKVGVNYRGEDAFKTKLGGLLSLATYTFAIINLVNLLTAFFDHSEQKETYSRIKVDTLEVGSLNLAENHVDIAIFTFLPINPFFGSWKAYRKKLYGAEKVELRLSACDFERINILEDYL